MQQLNGKQASLTIAEWAYEDSGAAIQVGATGVDEPHDEQRPADAGNPRGYFEYAPIKTLGAAVSTDQRWLTSAGGHAIKVIAQLLPKLPSGRRCRILFMERPLSEVVASQRQMLKQLGKDGAHSSDRRLASAYLNQVAQVKKLLSHYADHIDCLSVSYHQALEDPARTATRVNKFLGGGLNQQAMAATVEPTLRRQHRA